MKGNRAVLVAVVAIAVIAAGVWLFRKGGGSQQIDLVAQLSTAQRQPADGTFDVADVTLSGETFKAISANPPTRITWKVRVPDDGWLRVHVGMKPEAWTAEGDGVLFFAGVSDGRSYDPLFEQLVSPFDHPADRKWIPIMVDLSAYAGDEVDIVFNTRNSAPGKGDDKRNDLALWGAPEIIAK